MSLLRRIAAARLEGAKVSLRPVHPGDAPCAFGLLHDRREILRWLLWRGPSSVGELERSFAPWADQADQADQEGQNRDYLFAILEAGNERICGTVGLRFSGRSADADIGYWLAERVWGQGLGSEAIQLCCAFAFRHLKARALSAWAFVGNEASKKVLGRNGFSLMRTVLQKTESDGQAYDQWHFVLLAEEWLAQNEGWQPRNEQIDFAD